MTALSSDPAAAISFGSSFGSSQELEQGTNSSQIEPATAKEQSPEHLENQEQTSTMQSPAANNDKTPAKGPNVETSQPTITPLKANISFQSSESFDGSFSSSQGLSQSVPSTLGYLSNRWNAASSFSTPATSQAPAFMTPTRQAQPYQEMTSMRLSLTSK
jgi:flagellar basal body rod protein FlgB